MYLPPTALPHRLRVLVDPPLEFAEVRDDASRRAAPAPSVRSASAEPCEDAARPLGRSLRRQSNPCAD